MLLLKNKNPLNPQAHENSWKPIIKNTYFIILEVVVSAQVKLDHLSLKKSVKPVSFPKRPPILIALSYCSLVFLRSFIGSCKKTMMLRILGFFSSSSFSGKIHHAWAPNRFTTTSKSSFRTWDPLPPRRPLV